MVRWPRRVGVRYVRPRPALVLVGTYVVVAFALGALHVPLRAWAAGSLGRAGMGTAILVNLAMPALVVTLAAIYPRWWVALLGTFAATLVLLLWMGLFVPSFHRGWIIDTVLSMHPVLVVACPAYHVLAGATVIVLRPFRRVGTAPDPTRCRECGYDLSGLTEPRCPECGAACTITGEVP